MKKKKCIEMIAVVLFFVITCGLFIPSTSFLGNIDEFSVDYIQVFPLIGVTCLILGAVLLIIGYLLPEKVRWAFLCLIFAFTLGCYIQANFLNGALPTLNGKEVDWSAFKKENIISLMGWIVAFVFTFGLWAYKKHLAKQCMKYGSMLLCGMQTITLIVVLLTTNRTMSSNYMLTDEGAFELSSGRNTVVFVIDTLDAEWADTYIVQDAEYAAKMEDFIFYDNVVSGGAPTILGIPALLTGELWDCSTSLNQYYEKAYASSELFPDLKKNDCDIRMYTDTSLVHGADYSLFENAQVAEYSITDPLSFWKNLYRLTAYQVAPYFAKGAFYFYSGDMTNALGAKNAWYVEYNNVPFYQSFLKNKLTVSTDKDTFSFYHLFGVHGPCRMNEECETVNETDTSLEQATHGCVKIISEFIDEMKRLGIYESSTIIVTADHGGVAIYQNPAVFIKPAGYHGEITTNSLPATFRNVRASIAQSLLPNAEEYGLSLTDDLSVQEGMSRTHTADAILRQNIGLEQGDEAYSRFVIGDYARDVSSIEQYYSEYELGDTVFFDTSGSGNVYTTVGFSRTEDWGRWTDGNVAELMFFVGDVNRDLILDYTHDTFSQQNVRVYAGDTFLLEYDASGETKKTISIPSTSVQENGFLTIRFELPDAVSPQSLGLGEDTRLLAIGLKTMSIS